MAKSEGLQNSENQKEKAVFYKPWTYGKRWTWQESFRGFIAGSLGLLIAAA